jgi:hypothetical protein
MMHTTLHHTRRRHHHHTGSDPNRGQEALTGNRADKAHPNPAPLPGDNHIPKRRGIGSRSTKRTPEHFKIKTKENRNTKSHITERRVDERLTLNPPCKVTARRNISPSHWLYEKYLTKSRIIV